MKYAKYQPKIEITNLPPLTVDEEAFLVRESKWSPWKRMTRQQMNETYPGALDDFDTRSSMIREFYIKEETVCDKGTSEVIEEKTHPSDR